MKLILKPILIVQAMIAFFSCTNEVQLISLGIDDHYYIYRMQKLVLESAYTGEAYRWTIKTENGQDSLLSTERKLIFLSHKEQDYHLSFQILDSKTPYKHSFIITTIHEEVEYSPYINKVYEYKPAPGQFINKLPEYQPGDTEENMCKKAEECISGNINELISLGGYGGYVTFGFDHTVINMPHAKDFIIYGNAFYSDIPLYENEKGGSSEPGIVMVSYDTNMNGKPDDAWYELAGSEYSRLTTIKNYQITYLRPDPNHKPIPDMTGSLTDMEYIPWSDNQGQNGFIAKNKFHKQSYYPLWIEKDKLVFQGTCLPPNAIDESGFGTYWVLYAFDWGYADNHPNSNADLNSFDIDWAVDSLGNAVHLPGIDFVRVYTGVNQYCGWLGETSTEISKARDLHIDVPGNIIPDPIPNTEK